MLCENYLKPLFLSKPVIAELGKADPTGGYKLQSFQEPSVETLVLVPSERCNLCCTYCYEQHKHSQRMDIQTAKVAVRSAFSNLGPCKRLKIEFRGGEPFLEFDFAIGSSKSIRLDFFLFMQLRMERVFPTRSNSGFCGTRKDLL